MLTQERAKPVHLQPADFVCDARVDTREQSARQPNVGIQLSQPECRSRSDPETTALPEVNMLCKEKCVYASLSFPFLPEPGFRQFANQYPSIKLTEKFGKII